MSLTPGIKAILLVGPTGAGKTPLGNYLGEKGLGGRRCLHFDFGHQLREIASQETPPDGFDAGEHSFIRDVLEKGLLLENEHFHIAARVINRFAASRAAGPDDLLILNGLPRHCDQARDMDGLLDIIGLIVLDCRAEDVYARISQNTGKDRSGRLDDDLGMIRKKLEIFRERTARLVEYYSGSGRPVLRLQVSSSSTEKDLYHDLLSRYPG